LSETIDSESMSPEEMSGESGVDGRALQGVGVFACDVVQDGLRDLLVVRHGVLSF
jgi:hypothetical protein